MSQRRRFRSTSPSPSRHGNVGVLDGNNNSNDNDDDGTTSTGSIATARSNTSAMHSSSTNPQLQLPTPRNGQQQQQHHHGRPPHFSVSPSLPWQQLQIGGGSTLPSAIPTRTNSLCATPNNASAMTSALLLQAPTAGHFTNNGGGGSGNSSTRNAPLQPLTLQTPLRASDKQQPRLVFHEDGDDDEHASLFLDQRGRQENDDSVDDSAMQSCVVSRTNSIFLGVGGASPRARPAVPGAEDEMSASSKSTSPAAALAAAADDDASSSAILGDDVSCKTINDSSSNKKKSNVFPLDVLPEQFANVKFIAEGGYARVCSATDLALTAATHAIGPALRVAVKVMDFVCDAEDAQRLESLTEYGDVAQLLAGQEYVPSYIGAELRAHAALKGVAGTMPLLRVGLWCNHDEPIFAAASNVEVAPPPPLANGAENTSSSSSSLSSSVRHQNAFSSAQVANNGSSAAAAPTAPVQEFRRCYVMLVLPLLQALHSRSFVFPTKAGTPAPPPPASLLPAVAQIATTLQQMHRRRWLHRDLSCTNLFCPAAAPPLSSSSSISITVGDYGLACAVGGRAASAMQYTAPCSNACTTIWYRSPEILLEPTLPFSFEQDAWSLGAVACELALGAPVFPGMTREEQLRCMDEEGCPHLHSGNAEQLAQALLEKHSPGVEADVDDARARIVRAAARFLLRKDPAQRCIDKFLASLGEM